MASGALWQRALGLCLIDLPQSPPALVSVMAKDLTYDTGICKRCTVLQPDIQQSVMCLLKEDPREMRGRKLDYTCCPRISPKFKADHADLCLHLPLWSGFLVTTSTRQVHWGPHSIYCLCSIFNMLRQCCIGRRASSSFGRLNSPRASTLRSSTAGGMACNLIRFSSGSNSVASFLLSSLLTSD